MPRITVENINGKSIDCQSKTERLLDILLRDGDWMHTCGGKGRCTTCRVEVKSGMENLSDRTDSELNYFNLSLLKNNERLSCQAVCTGDLVISVPEKCKLPHIKYSN